MKIEIEQFITKNYFKLLEVAKNMTKNNDFAGDLLNDVIVQLYDKNEIKLLEYDDKSINYFIIAVMKINWFSKTSPFYRKVRKESLSYTEMSVYYELTQEDTTLLEHQILDLVEEEWAELDWFNKAIFEKYLVMGSLKKVLKDTTIPLASVGRYVKTTKKQIKKNVIKKLDI